MWGRDLPEAREQVQEDKLQEGKGRSSQATVLSLSTVLPVPLTGNQGGTPGVCQSSDGAGDRWMWK